MHGHKKTAKRGVSALISGLPNPSRAIERDRVSIARMSGWGQQVACVDGPRTAASWINRVTRRRGPHAVRTLIVIAWVYLIFYNRRMPYTVYSTEEFDLWLDGLRDRMAIQKIQARIDRASAGNLGDCAPVGSGVSEMRIHYGPGYRLYFIQTGMEIVVLLAGGDKSSQQADIKTAIALAQQL